MFRARQSRVIEPQPHREDRTSDQRDGYNIAAWLSRADRDGSLAAFPKPKSTPPERTLAQVEGRDIGRGLMTLGPVSLVPIPFTLQKAIQVAPSLSSDLYRTRAPIPP